MELNRSCSSLRVPLAASVAIACRLHPPRARDPLAPCPRHSPTSASPPGSALHQPRTKSTLHHTGPQDSAYLESYFLSGSAAVVVLRCQNNCRMKTDGPRL